MKKRLALSCCQCNKKFNTKNDEIWLEWPNGVNQPMRQFKAYCPACIKEWEKHWTIKSAEFNNENYQTIALFELECGEQYRITLNTATGKADIEAPETFHKQLMELFEQYRKERNNKLLKSCNFIETWDGMYFSCETNAGLAFDNVQFKINSNGQFQVKPNSNIPDYVLQQVIKRWGER